MTLGSHAACTRCSYSANLAGQIRVSGKGNLQVETRFSRAVPPFTCEPIPVCQLRIVHQPRRFVIESNFGDFVCFSYAHHHPIVQPPYVLLVCSHSPVIMEEETRAQYEAKSQALRLELKQWENEWVKTHNGKKPGRADIKANEEIGTFFSR